MLRLTTAEKNEIRELSDILSVNQLVDRFGVSSRSVRRFISAPSDYVDDDEYNPDVELVEHNVSLGKKLQKSRDILRIERKSFRENSRRTNAIQEYDSKLVKLLEESNLSDLTIKHDTISGRPVGMVQLSDVHFNEQINLEFNKYNFDIAARRIRKHINKAKLLFSTHGITDVVVVFTGDMLNSDRRLDELLENATNRSMATFVAVDILQQAILDLNSVFNVTVASICGNEGRVGKDVGWINEIASDNYDYTIHYMLKLLFQGSSVNVLEINNPLEQVIDVNGKHILLIHGHNGMAANGNIEAGVSKAISRYAVRGVKVDYVLLGHIHCHLSNVEVSTPTGFKMIKDFVVGDVVYGYKDGAVIETVVNDVIVSDYTGEMYQFNNNALSQLTTTGHNMYLKTGEYITANDYIANNRVGDVVTSASELVVEGDVDFPITDDEIRLLVATCADGSFDGKRVRFHLKKEHKIERLTKLFSDFGVELTWGKVSATGSVRNLVFDNALNTWIMDTIPNKVLPEFFKTLSIRQTNVVIDEMVYWDGWIGEGGMRQFSSIKPEELDLIQTLLTKVGIFSNICGARKATISFSINKNENTQRQKKVKYTTLNVENAEVGCLTTSSSNFFMRTSEGNIELSGNSANIGDFYARSSGLPGANAYSEKALNLYSRASQNLFIVNVDGIDGIKVDLQEVDDTEPYNFNKRYEAYNSKSDMKARMDDFIIHRIVI